MVGRETVNKNAGEVHPGGRHVFLVFGFKGSHASRPDLISMIDPDSSD